MNNPPFFNIGENIIKGKVNLHGQTTPMDVEEILKLLRIKLNFRSVGTHLRNSLAPQVGRIRLTILAMENPPSFNLQLMLLVKENHVRTRGNV